ncbi:MAG TPA: patatin-like phospholipase family protein [Haliangium sp.]|nr:patatin-like phospholipase family protein [Haliangium sp.]
MTRSVAARACLVVVLLLLAWLAPGALPDARAQANDRLGADRQPYALTISGGVSLGAYEAGLNWVILKALRIEQEASRPPIPELVGITGASAGSINALISALAWCQEGDGLGTVDDNRFRDIWMPIGFDTLLPASGNGYRSSDGWLTRKAFDRIIGEIEALMRDGKFRPGCSVLLGFTITRPDPAPMFLHGLRVTQQRVVMPLELSIEDGRPRFRPAIVKQRQELLGNTLYLAPTSKQGAIEHRAVLDAVLASSAFPLAFGRKTLVECVPIEPGQSAERACPSGRPVKRGACDYVSRHLDRETIACEDDFIDGGVFDNIPLGVAVAQIESSERVRDAARPVSYLYLEPDNRRLPPSAAGRRDREPPASVGANLTFVGGAVKTARNYELHNVLRYNAWNQHTDQLGGDAARLLWSLLSDPAALGAAGAAEPGDLQDLQAAVDALGAFVAARRDLGAQLHQCTDPGRPLAQGFSWSFDRPVAGADIVMRAMTCAVAILDARPNDAELRRGYARVASRSLAVIAERFRRARLRASRAEVENTLSFEPYRRFLLDEIARLDALAAGLVLSPEKVDPLTDRIRAAALSMQGHAPLEAYLRDASLVLAGLQTILRRDKAEDAPPGKLPSWAARSGWSLPGGGLDPGNADRLESAAAEVAARHRCAALLVATTHDLAALAARPRDQDADARLDRIQRIRASAASALDAVDCLAAAPGLPAVAPEAPGSSPTPTSQALAAARDIAERASAVVAPHRTALGDLSAIESIAPEIGLLDRAQRLVEQAVRKRQDVHEDRALMLSTRFAPLASSYFSAFSGFLDEPLRRHDYMVGVYDGLYGIAEQVCRGRGVPEPEDLDRKAEDEWTKCIRWQLGELATSLGVEDEVVDVLARLEHAPLEIRKGDPAAGKGNVAIVLNALVDPRRCGESRRQAAGPCLLDHSFEAFVAGLQGRGYTTEDPYMQRALDNPGAWWVTPAMLALRRMKEIEARAPGGGWKSASALAQRALMPLEDRMGSRWNVPSVLPPRFGWRLPWFRLSLTADWTIAGQDYSEGRYRLRPLGLATLGGRLGFYGDVGLRIGEAPTDENEWIVPEAGLAMAWRNTGSQYWLVSGAELAGHAAVTGAPRPRIDASGLLLTHLRLGAGYDFKTDRAYGFIGIDDPIGLAYSIASVWF